MKHELGKAYFTQILIFIAIIVAYFICILLIFIVLLKFINQR